MERSDVGRPVAEKTRRDLAGAADPGRPGQAAGDRQVGADDRVRAVVPVLGAGDVHRPALARADAAAAAEQLGQHGVGRRAAGQRVGVAAVGADRVVVRPQHRGRADRDRLVPEPEVGLPVDQPLPVQRAGPLLEGPQVAHPRVQVQVIRARRAGLRAGPALGPRCLVWHTGLFACGVASGVPDPLARTLRPLVAPIPRPGGANRGPSLHAGQPRMARSVTQARVASCRLKCVSGSARSYPVSSRIRCSRYFSVLRCTDRAREVTS